MEKSRDDSQEKPEEQVHDNGITNDQEEETCSKDEHVLVGRSDNSNSEQTTQAVEDAATKGSNGEGSCALSSDEIKHIVANFLAAMAAESSKGPSGDLRLSSDNIFRTSNGEESAYDGTNKIAPGESSNHKLKFSSFSSVAGAEKSNPLEHASSSKERRRKKNTKLRENASDVFTKMRNQARYILNKIKYEHSLIDAYGGEGWKGMSIDKLKPEKELQRASSEILRCKLRLREMFQRLDSICTEGAYPKSMFDSEGLLDSEDIYCTICGSKEISTDNDIVLCDGECNRAFHQLCLKPPLLTEEIPPEDQGWLCPGCDCKFDCTELLNDFFGSDLSMKDNWTSIFPEAATAAAGSNIDEILRLPSDDSEDDEFNPEDIDVDNKDKSGEGVESHEGEESESDDSDFSSASEDLGDFINKGQLVQELPNNVEDDDEEEDDDYDPEAPDPDNMDAGKNVEVEKSADGVESSEGEGSGSDESDFSSASEDLGDFVCKQLVGNNPDNSEDENYDFDSEVREPDPQNGISAELDTVTSPTNDTSEFVSAETEQDSHVTGSKKRDIERLDYKKLYDETYGNASSDSSDDEEWSEVGLSRKKQDRIKSGGSTTLKSKKRVSADDEVPIDTETKPQKAKDGTSRRSNKKLKASSDNGSIDKGSRSTLGETATQKLTEAFQKDHYPDRPVKEALANDLGLSYQKVDKWFGNARWSFNHPLHARSVSKSNLSTTSPPQTNAEGMLGIGKTLTSPNSNTIHEDASNTPSQPIRRRSSRLLESHTHTSNASGDDANKGTTDFAEGGPENDGAKQRGKKASPSAKK